MATDAQIRANKRNAQCSTGPRTPEGKQRSSTNATKHALTAKHVVLPWENIVYYFELHGALLRQYQPESPAEMFLVDQLAQNWWRLNRSRRFETGMLAKLDPATESEGVNPDDLDLHRRYEAGIERAYYRAYDRLEKIARRRPLVAKSDDPGDLAAPRESDVLPQTEAFTPVGGVGFVLQPASSTTPATLPSQPRKRVLPESWDNSGGRPKVQESVGDTQSHDLRANYDL